jgi:hypothetical protein
LVPQSFRIIPLPGTIISRIGELLRRLPSTTLLPTQPTPSVIAAGAAMNASSGESGDDSTPFLRRLGRRERLETFACFAAALREGRLGAQRAAMNRARASAGTVRATLDGVAQAYRLNQFESPIHDRHGRIEPVLALQLRGYADEDPGVKQQQRCHSRCSGGREG